MRRFKKKLLTNTLVISLLAFPAAGFAQSHATIAQPDASPMNDPATAAATPKAKNVILFLADAGGVAVLNAASLMAHGEPLKLHIQNWPHLGLSETSPVDKFVSDSANGMSSILTGVKTHNGVISQGPNGVRGKIDGTPTKTVLEYAEERGLKTGVVTTQSIADATPAAAYAHSNDRGKQGEIFVQAFAPRFGDGVDVMFGAGREKIGTMLTEMGTGFDQLAGGNDRPIYSALADVPAANARPIVVADSMDVRDATLRALDLLETTEKGYFLVVEWDAHTSDPQKGLQNVADFDQLMAEVEQRVDLEETLLLFTADHSFGLLVDDGERGQPLLAGYNEWKASGDDGDVVRLDNVTVDSSHTAEEVPALATGAGAHHVQGYFPNTHLFDVMMEAFGWQADPSPTP